MDVAELDAPALLDDVVELELDSSRPVTCIS
jgi:hypothetical protein